MLKLLAVPKSSISSKYIGSENWEAPPHSTVSTDENDSIMPSTLQWLDNGLHAMVKEV